jgi:hypothetical protein
LIDAQEGYGVTSNLLLKSSCKNFSANPQRPNFECDSEAAAFTVSTRRPKVSLSDNLQSSKAAPPPHSRNCGFFQNFWGYSRRMLQMRALSPFPATRTNVPIWHLTCAYTYGGDIMNTLEVHPEIHVSEQRQRPAYSTCYECHHTFQAKSEDQLSLELCDSCFEALRSLREPVISIHVKPRAQHATTH